MRFLRGCVLQIILIICVTLNFHCLIIEAFPGVLGIQGEGLFIFRDLGRMVIYFQGYVSYVSSDESITCWFSNNNDLCEGSRLLIH